MAIIERLAPLNNELIKFSQTDDKEINKDVERMYNHKSLINVANGFMRTEAFVMYLNKRYPTCDFKSDEWTVSFLIYNYVFFMALLKQHLVHEAYTQLSAPNYLDDIWKQHLLDNKGYNSFCEENFGTILYYDATPKFMLDEYAKWKRANNTISAYSHLGYQSSSVRYLILNGFVWNDSEIMTFARKDPEGPKRARRAVDDLQENQDIKRARTDYPFHVYVKDLQKRVMTLEVTKSTTMNMMADQVVLLFRVHRDKIKLIFNNRLYFQELSGACNVDGGPDSSTDVVDPTLTFEELGIKRDSMFHLVLKLRGC
ncbi:hypothetical protein CYMTET_6430 [Cymbomonas tetramitiformis]|uniref:Ubiquitin-like domain-containing protein n=2 Tax=Cymbomonas tetramitiformis TaxID=36881 RepID=A0AAE0GX36_9CHLO|nr:hypothetical protein CYMTET_6430 [Cymbomonas tetramitiformis]